MECQLYLIFPIIILLVKKFDWRTTLWITAIIELSMRAFAGIWATAYGVELPRWFSGSPFYYWFSWSIGAAAASAYLSKRELPFSKVPVWVFP